MDASLSFDTSAIVLTAEEAWFSQSSLRDAAWWAMDRGLLVPEPSGSSRTLTIELDEWSALGHGPSADGPDAIETWRFAHEAIAKLLGVAEETVVVQATGYVGGARLRIEVTVNGQSLNLHQSTPPKFEDTAGQPVLLSPVASALVDELVKFDADEQHARAEQLALIAELKRLRSLQQKLGGAGSRLRIHLDKHLDSFEIIEPERFAVRWTDEGRNRVSLKLFVQGETEPLPLENLDERAPIIQRSNRETVALDPGTAVVARRARELQEVRREKVREDILNNPLSLVPEGVETPRLDFIGWSALSRPRRNEQRSAIHLEPPGTTKTMMARAVSSSRPQARLDSRWNWPSRRAPRRSPQLTPSTWQSSAAKPTSRCRGKPLKQVRSYRSGFVM